MSGVFRFLSLNDKQTNHMRTKDPRKLLSVFIFPPHLTIFSILILKVSRYHFKVFTHINNVQWGKVKQIATASQWPMEDQVQVSTTNRALMCVLFTQSVKCFVCVFCLVLFAVVIFFLLRNCSDWGNTWIFLIKYGRIWIDMFIIIDEHRYEKWLFLTI